MKPGQPMAYRKTVRGITYRTSMSTFPGSPAGASPWPNTIRSQRAKGTVEAAPD